MSLADTNNNPLNIKFGTNTAKWVESGDAIIAGKAPDGGNFLKFSSPDIGFAAAQDLLSHPSYSNQTVDAAMKKWSGGGYGADVAAGTIPPNIKVADLKPDQKDVLIQSMAKREGYQGVQMAQSEQQGTSGPKEAVAVIQAMRDKASSTEPFQPLVKSPFLDKPITIPQEGDPGYTPASAEYAVPGAAEHTAVMERLTQLSQNSEQRYKEAALARQANIGEDDGIPTAAKWMTVIAALMGNMEPMIKLKLQSNQNLLTARAQPLLKEAQQLEAEGQRDKSFELLQQAQSQFGSKVPALNQQINARLDQVRASRLSYNKATALVDSWLKTTDKSDPNLPRIQALKIQLRASLPGAPEAVEQFAAAKALSRQLSPATNTSTIFSPEAGGPGVTTPLQVAAGPSALDSYAVKQIAADNQRTPQDVVNALNTPEHPMHEEFKKQLAYHSGVENNINIQSRIAGTPENIATIQVLSDHGDPDPQRTAAQGVKDPALLAEIVQQQRKNLTEYAKPAIEAPQQVERLEKGNQVALSYDPSTTNKLSYQRHGTADDAMKNGKIIFNSGSPVLAEIQIASQALVARSQFETDFNAIPADQKRSGDKWSNFLISMERLQKEGGIGGTIPFVGIQGRLPIGEMSPQMEKALGSYNTLHMQANRLSAIGGHNSAAVESMLNRIYGSVASTEGTTKIHLRTFEELLDRIIQQNLQQGGSQETQPVPQSLGVTPLQPTVQTEPHIPSSQRRIPK